MPYARPMLATLFLLTLGACGDSASPDSGVADAGRFDGAEGLDAGLDASMRDTASTDGDAEPPAPCPVVAPDQNASPVSGTAKAVWVQKTLSAGDVRLGGLVGDPSGGVYLAGAVTGTDVSIGRVQLIDGTPVEETVGFIAHYTDRGSVSWAVAFTAEGGTTWNRPPDAAATSDGVYVFGAVSSNLRVAGVDILVGAASLVVLFFDRAGGLAWSRVYPGLDPTNPNFRSATDGDGNLVLGVSGPQNFNFGNGPRDRCDGVFVEISPRGAVRYDRCASSRERSYVVSDGLTVDAAGDVYFSFFPRATFDVGLGPESLDSSFGASIVVKFDGDDGHTIWVRRLLRAYARDLSADALGNIYTHGDIPGIGNEVVLFDRPVSTCELGFRTHLTRFNAAGERLGTVLVGDVSGGLTVAKDGRTYFAIQGDQEPFSAKLPTPAASALAAFAPDGEVAWLQSIDPPGDTNDVSIARVAIDGSGLIYVAADARGLIRLENGATLDVGFGTVLFRFND